MLRCDLKYTTKPLNVLCAGGAAINSYTDPTAGYRDVTITTGKFLDCGSYSAAVVHFRSLVVTSGLFTVTYGSFTVTYGSLQITPADFRLTSNHLWRHAPKKLKVVYQHTVYGHRCMTIVILSSSCNFENIWSRTVGGLGRLVLYDWHLPHAWLLRWNLQFGKTYHKFSDGYTCGSVVIEHIVMVGCGWHLFTRQP